MASQSAAFDTVGSCRSLPCRLSTGAWTGWLGGGEHCCFCCSLDAHLARSHPTSTRETAPRSLYKLLLVPTTIFREQLSRVRGAGRSYSAPPTELAPLAAQQDGGTCGGRLLAAGPSSIAAADLTVLSGFDLGRCATVFMHRLALPRVCLLAICTSLRAVSNNIVIRSDVPPTI